MGSPAQNNPSFENTPDLFRLTRQGALTVIAIIKPNEVEKLRELLATIRRDVGKETCPIRYDNLKTVHFMRWVILDADPQKKLPAILVLSTNYDGPVKDHIRELANVPEDTLHRIYQHCEGYEGPNTLIPYLTKRQVPYAAFYVGTTGRSVRLIKEEARLRDSIQDYLQQAALWGTEPTNLRTNIIGFVGGRDDLRWACRPPTKRDWYIFNYWPFILLAAFILAYVVAIVLVPWIFDIAWWILPVISLVAIVLAVLAIVIPIVVIGRLVVVQEQRDAVDDIRTHIERVSRLAQREDQIVQNQLTHLVDIKPQWFRPIALRIVLGLINVLARYVFIRGMLGGIPTIHFARWVIIPGRRLLFFSNYDGSWENYLGDFIDKASQGLTAIWSNTEGCPRAEGLVNAGAKDEQRFKAWTRNHQIFTDVWYSAYPDLTVDNINNNSFIRIGLAGQPDVQATADWLARI